MVSVTISFLLCELEINTVEVSFMTEIDYQTFALQIWELNRFRYFFFWFVFKRKFLVSDLLPFMP